MQFSVIHIAGSQRTANRALLSLVAECCTSHLREHAAAAHEAKQTGKPAALVREITTRRDCLKRELGELESFMEATVKEACAGEFTHVANHPHMNMAYALSLIRKSGEITTPR